jgi:hypothetical protein
MTISFDEVFDQSYFLPETRGTSAHILFPPRHLFRICSATYNDFRFTFVQRYSEFLQSSDKLLLKVFSLSHRSEGKDL